MTEEIIYADAATLARRIRDRELSPVEVAQAHLDRIEAVNPRLNALIAFPDGVMERAREAEAAVARGEIWGPLHGVPFTVKDCVDTEGVVTTRGSKLFEDHVPGADATVVKRLKNAGGIFIAKSNMPEFALWWETDNLVYGRTENPWMIGRTPGGSSGGEAAAVASGMSPLGIGSDVGGSIREPSNYCGIVGLKATHGRIPLTGHWPETLLRFMHVGPIVRSVGDAALALGLMAGPDGVDHYALPVPVPNVSQFASPAGLRVAWCPEGPFAPVDRQVQGTVASAATALGELGCTVEEVGLEAGRVGPGSRFPPAYSPPRAMSTSTPSSRGARTCWPCPCSDGFRYQAPATTSTLRPWIRSNSCVPNASGCSRTTTFCCCPPVPSLPILMTRGVTRWARTRRLRGTP